jgi:hypothetical protein
MTEKQQRIAIAEACGWTEIGVIDYLCGIHPQMLNAKAYDGSPLIPPIWEIPDYLHDLNAMHEAIETLSVGEKSTYIMQLMDTCCKHPIGCVPDWTRDRQSLARLTQATAAHRAEAFLKTIDKWIQ